MGINLFKKVIILALIVALAFTGGCSNKKNGDGDGQSAIISPDIKINEQYYRGVLPYRKSPINGTLRSLPNRLDASHFELTLFEYAKKSFNPASHVFAEGHILTNAMISPYISAERGSFYEGFVYSMLEHDYYAEDGTFKGMVVGVTVSPTYYATDENGEYLRNVFGERIKQNYTTEEIVEKSKSLLEDLTLLIRRETFVPIEFAVMRAEGNDTKIPGTFVLTASTLIGERSVAKFTPVNEKFHLLPIAASKLTDNETDISRAFNQFKKDIGDFLPRFAGVTGLARFVDGAIVELKLEMYTEFDSAAEVIQLTQFSIDRIGKYFPERIPINLYVSTINKPKALYIRSANGDDFMHIYRN